MRLLAIIVRPTSENAYRFLLRECLSGAEIYAPQPEYSMPKQITILRNPHISRNEEVLVTPLKNVGPIRKKYLSHLYYVAMVDSRSLIPDRLGGADYDGDLVHLYADPILCDCIARNYSGGLDNASNLPLLKTPLAEPLIADASDWHARFETVKSTFSSRVGQISNAALRRSILAYDEATPENLREQYRKETEILTILTGLEIDSAKSGIKPDLAEYLGNRAKFKDIFLRYKEIVGEPDEHAWYDPTKNKKLKTYFDSVAYAKEFPELVTPDGDGWLIRHVENIIAFVEDNPDAVRKGVAEKAQALKKGFRKQWANKLRQMQVTTFASNTKGAWVLRFDDILADALELGPLQNRDFDLPEETIQRITELTPKGVPGEASILLYKYYVANKADDREYVLLPQQNFNAWFDSTYFSQKWIGALNGKLIEKKVLDGVCKYRIVLE